MLETARARDPGLAAALELSKLVGLRSQEAVQSAQSLRTWKQSLDNALVVAEDRHGRLIDKSDLKTAMKYWHSQALRLGLTGTYSPYSLRYAWVQDAIRHYLAQGFYEKEGLAMTAMDLGHGDGRGRYVAQVYGRNYSPSNNFVRFSINNPKIEDKSF